MQITIPDTVTSIGDHTFRDCSSLTSITIPNSVTSIGNATFINCSSLTSIEIPDSVTFIDNYAFYDCSSLQTINFDGIATQWNAISKGKGWNNKNPTSMVINCIGDYLSFTRLDSSNYSVKAASKSIKEVVVPNTYSGKSVTMIENDAFLNCTGLTSITIPNNVTSIGAQAFRYCTSLQTINFDGTTAQWNAIIKGEHWNDKTPRRIVINCIGDYLAFTQLDSSTYSVKASSKSIREVAIPSTFNDKPVTMIENDAFFSCASLTSIEIPDSVTSIGKYAFCKCISLTSITIPNSVTFIDDYTFYNCTSLTSITIPYSVTSIGTHAFSSCSAITSVTIPNSVTFIDEYAFSYCSSLQTINFDGTTTQWNAINKSFLLNGSVVPASLVIHCTDGAINL